MKKVLITAMLFALSIFLAIPASAGGQFRTYLDYINIEDADNAAKNPAMFVELDLNNTIGLVGGFAANRTEAYEANFGLKLYSNDLYGQLLLNEDLDPALRAGVDVDVADNVFITVGYEWLYTKVDDRLEFDPFGSPEFIVGCGIRW